MSRKNLGAKPYLFPMPVMIIGTYDAEGNPNAMNAAWGGIVGRDEIIVDLGQHKTTENLAVKKAFTISIADAAHVVPCDYVGIESGRKVPNKFEVAGFHASKSEFVDAPLIDELPMALECKVKSFNDGILIGEIVNVSADESVITDGNVDLKKLRPIAFDPCNNKYVKLGDAVGDAFSCGKKLKG